MDYPELAPHVVLEWPNFPMHFKLQCVVSKKSDQITHEMNFGGKEEYRRRRVQEVGAITHTRRRGNYLLTRSHPPASLSECCVHVSDFNHSSPSVRSVVHRPRCRVIVTPYLTQDGGGPATLQGTSVPPARQSFRAATPQRFPPAPRQPTLRLSLFASEWIAH
jgi:hypothetical protein